MIVHTARPFENLHAVHLVGIGGIGVSALARLLVRRGVRVSGSDRAPFHDQNALEALGITITIGHTKLPHDSDALIYSPAVPQDDPERAEAHARNIPEYSYPEALGILMQDHYGIAVSGTNGKTTTTALLGLMLEEAGMDPTVVVGGMIPAWSGNMRIGQGSDFVAEGCEYRRHMLHLHPSMIVLTNIAEDHLDYYRDLGDIKDAFGTYVRALPQDGVLIYNADDPATVEVARQSAQVRKVSFSLAGDAEYTARDTRMADGMQQFTIMHDGNVLGMISTPLPGAFNRANVLAAAAAAHMRGASFAAIAAAAAKFSGPARRFERVGIHRGTPVVSDYAHHPDAVSGTIAAAREAFPDRKIVAVFQPHQTDRTIKLFDGFVSALVTADEVVLAEIYRVAGREKDSQKISSHDLANAINARVSDRAVYAADISAAHKLLDHKDLSQAVILVMGAGNIDTLARTLVAR